MNNAFLVPASAVVRQAVQAEGDQGGGHGITRRHFIKRTGAATAAVVVASSALMSMHAHAHDPSGNGSYLMKCTAPATGEAMGNAKTLSGAPDSGGNTRVIAEEFSSGWAPEGAAVQYKWVFWGYLQSRAKDDSKISKDEPVFNAGGKLGKLMRERTDPDNVNSAWGAAEWLSWSQDSEEWQQPNTPQLNVLNATHRPCPPHTRNGCVAVNKDDGTITSHEEGDADSPQIAGMKTTIPIAANGSSVTGKAKFTTPSFETGEISITVTYSSTQ